MGMSGSIGFYKHRQTRRYLNMQDESGEFYLHGNRTLMKVGKAAALAYVFGENITWNEVKEREPAMSKSVNKVVLLGNLGKTPR